MWLEDRGMPGRLFLFWLIAMGMFGAFGFLGLTFVAALAALVVWSYLPLEFVWSWTGLRLQLAIVLGISTACCFTKEAYSVWRKP